MSSSLTCILARVSVDSNKETTSRSPELTCNFLTGASIPIPTLPSVKNVVDKAPPGANWKEVLLSI